MKTIFSRESADGSSWRVALEWKLEDCWVGAFWKSAEMHLSVLGRPSIGGGRVLDIWVCLVPCLPVHITLRRLP